MKRSVVRADRPLVHIAPHRAAVACFILLACLASSISAAPRQQEDPPVPPPPRVITDAEKAQLAAAETDRRKRLRLTLDLADAHLTRAEQLTGERRYAPASAELGAYEALIENAFAFVRGRDVGGARPRDLYKRLEQTLRAHVARIEALRRITPTAYAVHVAATAKFTREVRTKALDRFFGEGTMRGETSDSSSPSASDESRSLIAAPAPPAGR